MPPGGAKAAKPGTSATRKQALASPPPQVTSSRTVRIGQPLSLVSSAAASHEGGAAVSAGAEASASTPEASAVQPRSSSAAARRPASQSSTPRQSSQSSTPRQPRFAAPASRQHQSKPTASLRREAIPIQPLPATSAPGAVATGQAAIEASVASPPDVRGSPSQSCPATPRSSSLRPPPSPSNSLSDRATLPASLAENSPILTRRRNSSPDQAFMLPKRSTLDAATVPTRVSVVVRIRPRLKGEDKQMPDCIEVSSDSLSVALSNGRDTKCFTVDQVVDSRIRDQSQQFFFDTIGPGLVNHSMKGYNVCVFAYGHTGSGKTYTMLGDGVHSRPNPESTSAGLLPRFLHTLFKPCGDGLQTKRWRCSCEFYEVYNEMIRDLLSPAARTNQRTGRVHVHPKYGVRVDGLSSCVFSSEEEALGLLSAGSQIRTIAGTTLNERSSRSHAFFTFSFKYEETVGEDGLSAHTPRTSEASVGRDFQSTVTFVDLAGREDRSASENRTVQFREMCHINTSLFHLAHLIKKVGSSDPDKDMSLSDFRNSKLTLLLSQALTGNSRTALVATLAPSSMFFEDSCSTMGFAASVKKIQTRPVVNNKSTKAVIAELEAEVRRLQRELENQKTFSPELQENLNSSQAMIAYYKRTWEDAIEGSVELKQLLQQTVVRLGLDAPGTMEADGSMRPYLTKLCDDPLLQGACNYFLSKNELRLGSDDELCDIVLYGVGIAGEMCAVVRDETTGLVEVSLLETENESVHVVVGGRELSRVTPRHPMSHGDSLILGYSHAFRLVVPTAERMREAGSVDALDLARSSLGLPKLDVGSAMMEHQTMNFALEMLPYVRHLGTYMCSEEIDAILKDASCLGRLLDEANLITREIWGSASIHFELKTLSSITRFGVESSDLVICLLETLSTPKPDTSSGEEEEFNDLNSREICYSFSSKYPKAHNLGLTKHMFNRTGDNAIVLLGVVTVEDFLLRLDAIRDVYQDACDADDGAISARRLLSERPYSNPWNISSFADVKVLAELAATTRSSPVVTWLADKESGKTRLQDDYGGARSLPVRRVRSASRLSPTSSNKAEFHNLMKLRTRSFPSFADSAMKEGMWELIQRIPDEQDDDEEQPRIKRMPSKLLASRSVEALGLESSVEQQLRQQRSVEELHPDSGTERQTCLRSKTVTIKFLADAAVAAAEAAAAKSADTSPQSLTDYWRSMLLNQSSADLELYPCDPEGRDMDREPPLLAHSAAMGRLPFFAALLPTGQAQMTERGSVFRKEIRVPGVGRLALERIREFAYTDDVEAAVSGLREEDLGRLVVAARLCNIVVLQNACAEFGSLANQPARVVNRTSVFEEQMRNSIQIGAPPVCDAEKEDLQEQILNLKSELCARESLIQQMQGKIFERLGGIGSISSASEALDVSDTRDILQACDLLAGELRQALQAQTNELWDIGIASRGEIVHLGDGDACHNHEASNALQGCASDRILVRTENDEQDSSGDFSAGEIVWRPRRAMDASSPVVLPAGGGDGGSTSDHGNKSEVASLALYFDGLDFHRVKRELVRQEVVSALCQHVGGDPEGFADVHVKLHTGGLVAEVYCVEGSAADELLRRMTLGPERNAWRLEVLGRSARIMSAITAEGEQLQWSEVRRDLVMQLKNQIHSELWHHSDDKIRPSSSLPSVRSCTGGTSASESLGLRRKNSELSLVASAVAELVEQLRIEFTNTAGKNFVAPTEMSLALPMEPIARPKVPPHSLPLSNMQFGQGPSPPSGRANLDFCSVDTLGASMASTSRTSSIGRIVSATPSATGTTQCLSPRALNVCGRAVKSSSSCVTFVAGSVPRSRAHSVGGTSVAMTSPVATVINPVGFPCGPLVPGQMSELSGSLTVPAVAQGSSYCQQQPVLQSQLHLQRRARSFTPDRRYPMVSARAL